MDVNNRKYRRHQGNSQINNYLLMALHRLAIIVCGARVQVFKTSYTP